MAERSAAPTRYRSMSWTFETMQLKHSYGDIVDLEDYWAADRLGEALSGLKYFRAYYYRVDLAKNRLLGCACFTRQLSMETVLRAAPQLNWNITKTNYASAMRAVDLRCSGAAYSGGSTLGHCRYLYKEGRLIKR